MKGAICKLISIVSILVGTSITIAGYACSNPPCGVPAPQHAGVEVMCPNPPCVPPRTEPAAQMVPISVDLNIDQKPTQENLNLHAGQASTSSTVAPKRSESPEAER